MRNQDHAKPWLTAFAALVVFGVTVAGPPALIPPALAFQEPSGSPAEILKEKLGSGDVKARVAAIERADRMGGEAVPIVATALTDEDERVRSAAAQFIGEHSGPEGVRYFSSRVGEETSRLVLERMMRALQAWNTPAAIDTLVKIVKSGKETVRLAGLDVLRTTPGAAVDAAIVSLTEEEETEGVRIRAFQVLHSRRQIGGLESARRALALSDNPILKMTAAKLMGLHPCAAVRADLESAMKVEDPGQAAHGHEQGDDEAPKTVGAKLARPGEQLRETATRSLAEACGLEAFSALSAMLDWSGTAGEPPAPTGKMKTSLAAMLQEHPSPQGLPVLVRLMASEEPYVRRQAVFALAELDPTRASAELTKFAGDADENVRGAIAHRLGLLGQPAVAPLTRLLADDALSIRLTAARSLGRIGGPAATKALLNALGDSEIAMRAEVATSLGVVGSRTAVPALIGVASDTSPVVRANAIGSLGTLGDAKSVETLIRSASDDEPLVRRAAIQALGRIGDPRGRAAIRTAMRDSDPGVRAAAREALKGLPGAGTAG